MIFGTLQRRFVLNISVNFNLKKSITQGDATPRKLATRILLSTITLLEFQHKMLSRTSLKSTAAVYCSKDGKVGATHGLLQQQQTLCVLCLIATADADATKREIRCVGQRKLSRRQFVGILNSLNMNQKLDGRRLSPTVAATQFTPPVDGFVVSASAM